MNYFNCKCLCPFPKANRFGFKLVPVGHGRTVFLVEWVTTTFHYITGVDGGSGTDGWEGCRTHLRARPQSSDYSIYLWRLTFTEDSGTRRSDRTGSGRHVTHVSVLPLTHCRESL